MDANLQRAADALLRARHGVVFTGAGMSVESGIPTFRGPTGLWSRYNPSCLDIRTFHQDPKSAWIAIKEIFYDSMGAASPNAGHRAVAELEALGRIAAVVTQNIDCLHQAAGSKVVHEFHGTIAALRCQRCGKAVAAKSVRLDVLPPWCPSCNGVLKPDFVFFGEPIPAEVGEASFAEGGKADVMVVVGTTGEVTPACHIPVVAKDNGATIIEVNIEPSAFTHGMTDIFLEGPAGRVLPALVRAVGNSADLNV